MTISLQASRSLVSPHSSLSVQFVMALINGVARIFVWGGPLFHFFHDLRRPARFSGGGVVAEIVRDPHKPARFSGGGGVVAEFFRDYNLGQEFFCPVTEGHDRSNHLHSGTLCLHFPHICIFSEIHCRKKTFTGYFPKFIAEKKNLTKVWGGPWPPWPPPWLRHWR